MLFLASLLHCLWAPLSHLFLLGHPWPIYFPWTSLALFLIQRSHGLLLTPLDFLALISVSLILGVHGLSINPYFLYLHYFELAMTHSHFSTLHTAYKFATSLFPDSFKPVCILKVHLFMLWVYDPLFLRLGSSIFLSTH